MRTTNYLKLSALVLGSIAAGCGSTPSSSGPGTFTGGGNNGTGGVSNTGTNSTTVGGNSTPATGAGGNSTTVGGTSSGNTGGSSSGNNTGGVSSTATGGTSGNTTGGVSSTTTGGKSSTSTGGSGANTGGTSSTSTGGSGAGTGGTSSTTTGGSGANTGGTSSTSTGGSGATTGGTTASNTGGAGACTKPANLISDFEDTAGKGTIVANPPVSTMDGYWYAFKESSCTQTPASVDGAAVNSEQLPSSEQTECNKYAMHSTVSSCGGASKYSGFGASLHPTSSDGKKKGPVDLSAYDGVTFKIKGSSSTQIYVEFQTTECVDADNGGTSTSSNSDSFNCHGYLIKSVPTSWTQMYVPFGLTGVRWFPTATSGGTTTCASSEFCEAPILDRKKIVDIQFALEAPFNDLPQQVASYDVWIDDLALYKFSDAPENSGLQTYTQSGNFPFPANKTFSGCTNPAGADGKLLQDAYLQWKSKFVTGSGSSTKVISPEMDNGSNPTVSEGIAYGMLIAVYMGDKTLFDGLLGYWKAHPSNNSMLMDWKQGGDEGDGSATDADEDAAFALQMARKQWPSGGYDSDASTILSQILSADVDSSNHLKPGNNFSDGTSLSNPSYFAPAFYKYFATVDTANASKWNSIVTNGYSYLSNISGSNGLVPAWCSGTNCSQRGGGNYTDSDKYQYDSHRTPWRTGLDACWNGSNDAKTYINKVVGFFAGKAGSGKSSNSGGLGVIGDIYDSGGTVTSNSAANSMSLLGCAGVGSMAYTGTNAATFRDRVWAFLLEGHYTRNYMYTNGDSATDPGYTYYNATVGLLTALSMSGNFYIMQ